MDKESLELLFLITHSLNKSNLFFEKNEVIYTNNNKEIAKKKCTTELRTTTQFICGFQLEETKEIILIKENHKYFLEAYSIVIGDKTNLYQGINKKNNKTYIFERELLETISSIMELEKISQIPAQYINKKTFKTSYSPLPKIKEIQEYSLNSLNVNLKQIHIVNHDKLELFLPTQNHKHNKIAHTLKIPLINVKNNNYFTGTTIHVDDYESQKTMINPLHIIKEKTQTLTFNKEIVEPKLSKKIYLKLDPKTISNNLSSLENTNIDLEKYYKLLQNKKELLFGTQEGETILPIFKKNILKTFKNLKQFKEESGIEYKENNSFLNKVRIQKSANEQYFFKNYYLNSQLEELFKNSSKEDIHCTNFQQAFVLLAVNYSKDCLFIEQNISQKKIHELRKHIFSLSKFTIKQSVKFNSLPKEKRAETGIEHFLLSTYSQIEKELKEFKKNKNKKKLLKNSLKSIYTISEMKKTLPIKSQTTYFLYQCILSYLKVLKEFDQKKEKTISSLLKEYFGEVKYRPLCSKINKKNESLIKDCILLNKIAKKKHIFIIIKKELYSNYIPKNIPKLPTKASFSKVYYRANIHKLKEIAPYSYNHIVKQINGQTLPKTITINKKELECREEFYYTTRFHNNFKEIISNEIFCVFVNQNSKTKKPESSSIISENFT